MKRKILEIINKNGIRDAGFCDYSLVKERLLPCRALQRLPENAKTVIIEKISENKRKITL